MSHAASASDKGSPMWVIRCLNSLVQTVPLPGQCVDMRRYVQICVDMCRYCDGTILVQGPEGKSDHLLVLQADHYLTHREESCQYLCIAHLVCHHVAELRELYPPRSVRVVLQHHTVAALSCCPALLTRALNEPYVKFYNHRRKPLLGLLTVIAVSRHFHFNQDFDFECETFA